MKRKAIIIATTVLCLCLISGCQNEGKKTEKQNLTSSSEVNKETNSSLILDESRIIKDQTFDVTLNDWGEVTFVTYGPEPGTDFEDVTFF